VTHCTLKFIDNDVYNWLGLNVNSTNAPAGEMEEAPEVAVVSWWLFLSLIYITINQC